MGKANFTGQGGFPYPDPIEKQDAPRKAIGFEQSKGISGTFNPLSGVGEDSRPQVDDNVEGNNRWPMGEKKQVDGKAGRVSKSFGSGPGKLTL